MIRITLAVLGCSVFVAGCPSTFELGFPGPREFRTFDDHYWSGIVRLPVTVYHPDETPPEGGYPLIVLTGGWNQPRIANEGYAVQLAQWGYVVAVRFLPTFSLELPLLDQAEELSAVIDWCAEQNETSDSPLFGAVDTSNVGTAGHSMGATLSAMVPTLEPRIKAVVALDAIFQGPESFGPAGTLEGTDTASLYIMADRDGDIFPLDVYFDNSSAPAMEAIVVGSDHADFADSLVGFGGLATRFSPSGPADPQDVRDISARYMVSWFNFYLKGENDFETYFNGEELRKDIEDGLVVVRRNL